MENDHLPLFSVIIPLKDRAEYIEFTLRTCMIQDYPNFEIIVSDDCSMDNTVEVIKKLESIDKRIKLFTHTTHLGMRDNFEFALNQVRPGYVMALGGDDGLTPGCIWRMYKIIQETGTELLAWNPAGFVYPDKPGEKNIFYFKRKKYSKLCYIDSKDYLNKIASSFFYPTDDCPMFYVKGLASTQIVDKVKSRTPDHCFYYSPTPDGFSGVVLAGEVKQYVYADEPLSIIGNTKKSQGRNYHRTDKKSKEEAQQFFNDNMTKTMHKNLASQPYSPLVTLMTADYLLTASDLPGWHGDYVKFTIEELIKKTFSFISICSFEDEVLVRELRILREIAIQHNLLDLFNSLYKSTIRKKNISKTIYGFIITHSVRFEGTSIGIHNIFDACLAINFAYQVYGQLSIKSFFAFLSRMIKLILSTKRIQKKQLPRI